MHLRRGRGVPCRRRRGALGEKGSPHNHLPIYSSLQMPIYMDRREMCTGMCGTAVVLGVFAHEKACTDLYLTIP